MCDSVSLYPKCIQTKMSECDFKEVCLYKEDRCIFDDVEDDDITLPDEELFGDTEFVLMDEDGNELETEEIDEEIELGFSDGFNDTKNEVARASDSVLSPTELYLATRVFETRATKIKTGPRLNRLMKCAFDFFAKVIDKQRNTRKKIHRFTAQIKVKRRMGPTIKANGINVRNAQKRQRTSLVKTGKITLNASSSLFNGRGNRIEINNGAEQVFYNLFIHEILHTLGYFVGAFVNKKGFNTQDYYVATTSDNATNSNKDKAFVYAKSLYRDRNRNGKRIDDFNVSVREFRNSFCAAYYNQIFFARYAGNERIINLNAPNANPVYSRVWMRASTVMTPNAGSVGNPGHADFVSKFLKRTNGRLLFMPPVKYSGVTPIQAFDVSSVTLNELGVLNDFNWKTNILNLRNYRAPDAYCRRVLNFTYYTSTAYPLRDIFVLGDVRSSTLSDVTMSYRQDNAHLKRVGDVSNSYQSQHIYYPRIGDSGGRGAQYQQYAFTFGNRRRQVPSTDVWGLGPGKTIRINIGSRPPGDPTIFVYTEDKNGNIKRAPRSVFTQSGNVYTIRHSPTVKRVFIDTFTGNIFRKGNEDYIGTVIYFCDNVTTKADEVVRWNRNGDYFQLK